MQTLSQLSAIVDAELEKIDNQKQEKQEQIDT